MRTLSLSLLTLLSFSLIGCGGSKAPDPATTDAPPAATTDSTDGGATSDGMTDQSSASTEASSAAPTESASAGTTLDYIPEDAVMAVLIRPSQALGNELVKKLIATFEEVDGELSVDEKFAEMEEETGIRPEKIDHVLVMIDQQFLSMAPMLLPFGALPPANPNGAGIEYAALQNPNVDRAAPRRADVTAVQFDFPAENAGDQFDADFPQPNMMNAGPPVVVQLVAGVDSQTVLDSIPGDELVEQAGYKGKVAPNGGTVFRINESRLMFLHDVERLEPMLKGAGAGKVKAMLQQVASKDFAIALDLAPVKQFLQMGMQQNPNPIMGMIMPLVTQMESISISADLTGSDLLQISVSTPNADAAEGVKGMLEGYLGMAKAQYAQAKESVPAEFQAMAQQLVDGAALKSSEKLVSLTLPRPSNIAELPELVKPMLTQARKSAGSAKEKNNLKQIGLAFHNYHDTYNRFPALDSNGQPDEANVRGKGLSWRVHILPFLEEPQLYSEFNLDEPWDSEHNKALIERMPAVFGNNPEGKTSIDVFAGEGLMFEEGKPGPGIRDIIDGTSNTLLVVQAGEDKADFWTKPGGLELDPEDAKKGLGEIGETFLVLFCDGSVRALPGNLASNLFKLLVTHNDGQPVDFLW